MIKNKSKKAFTIIELIVVIAILAILVLLATPKFIGYTKDAKLAQIKNDVKAHESAIGVKMIEDDNFKDVIESWNVVENSDLEQYNKDKSLFNKRGLISDSEVFDYKYYEIPKKEVSIKTKLKGTFILTKDGEVFYHELGINTGDDSNSGNGSGGSGDDGSNPNGGDNGSGGSDSGDSGTNPPNTPDVYLAADSDFEWMKDPYGTGTYVGINGEIGAFYYIGKGHPVIEIPNVIQGIKMTSYYAMFSNRGEDIEKVISNNENIIDMSFMFYNSKSTQLDLSELNTSNVVNMEYMFSGSKAESLDLSSFDTSKVVDMSRMFYKSQTKLLNLSNFDNSNVTTMFMMFYESQATSINLNNFNTSNVISMSDMFSRSQATSLDLSSFDTFNVTNMSTMFERSQATSLNLSSFNTSNVIDMRSMFDNSKVMILDLSSFDISNVESWGMAHMFNTSVATIGYAKSQKEIDKFNIASTSKPSTLTFIVK